MVQPRGCGKALKLSNCPVASRFCNLTGLPEARRILELFRWWSFSPHTRFYVSQIFIWHYILLLLHCTHFLLLLPPTITCYSLQTVTTASTNVFLSNDFISSYAILAGNIKQVCLNLLSKCSLKPTFTFELCAPDCNSSKTKFNYFLSYFPHLTDYYFELLMSLLQSYQSGQENERGVRGESSSFYTRSILKVEGTCHLPPTTTLNWNTTD